MNAELDAIREAVDKAVNEVDVIVSLPDSPERNKRGIEVHAQLEQAASDLAAFRKLTRSGDPLRVEADALRFKILGNVRRVLQKVFYLPESDLPPVKPMWAASFPTPDEEPEEPGPEPTVADGLVAIAGAINNLARAIHYHALPPSEKRRHTF